MTHVLSLFDSDYLHHYDLPEKEYVVEIDKVEACELTGQGGRKTKKPLVFFKGHKKALGLNKTNAKTIIRLYGTQVEDWVGKRVTLYETTTEMAGETVECIRVRPKAPATAVLKAAQ